MTEIELTKEIYEKYPKVWEKFKIENKCKHKKAIFCGYGNDGHPLDMYEVDPCYCDFENFFEENGIYLNIHRLYTEKERFLGWIYDIENLPINDLIFKSKNEAKQQAILKACEILNKQLED